MESKIPSQVFPRSSDKRNVSQEGRHTMKTAEQIDQELDCEVLKLIREVEAELLAQGLEPSEYLTLFGVLLAKKLED